MKDKPKSTEIKQSSIHSSVEKQAHYFAKAAMGSQTIVVNSGALLPQ
jgi:hypothetical protein